MKEYIDKIIGGFTYRKEVNNMKSMNTPAAECLLMVKPKTTNMDTEKADAFHTTIYKALFISNIARPDIQPTVT